MEFPKAEIVFYLAVFIASGFACLARIWRDNERAEFRVICGRCLSSGVLSFGAVAIWMGDTHATTGSGAYWLAIAALIGYCSRDIQDQILTRFVGWILKKFAPEDHAN